MRKIRITINEGNSYWESPGAIVLNTPSDETGKCLCNAIANAGLGRAFLSRRTIEALVSEREREEEKEKKRKRRPPVNLFQTVLLCVLCYCDYQIRKVFSPSAPTHLKGIQHGKILLYLSSTKAFISSPKVLMQPIQHVCHNIAHANPL